jgi:hypothetical protein
MAAKKSAKKAAPAKKAGARKAAARKAPAKKASAKAPASEAKLVEAWIEDLPAWQTETLSRMRRLIREAVPDVVEEIKWRKPSNPDGVPVWSRQGLICTGEAYKDHVRLTFLNGAAIPDPAGVFNSGFVGVRRAILLKEGDKVDEGAFKAIVGKAAALNAARG